MVDRIEITRPDDWHVHFRDGDLLKETVAATAQHFSRAVIMPNLLPPILTVQDAVSYKQRILECLPKNYKFNPLMTLYLTDYTTLDSVREVKESEDVVAFKLYPAGVTTNSDRGVTDIIRMESVFDAMQTYDIPLLVHGEVSDEDVDIFDREKIFLERVMIYLVEKFPQLRIVLEHITTADAVSFVRYCGDRVAATITAHHLLYDRNALLSGGIKPHYYCLPVLKKKRHQRSLLEAATGDDARFFLGTDSAPHVQSAKENVCGCAGCYTAPVALSMYTEAFEMMGALDKLEAFIGFRGADFYELPRNKDTIIIKKEPWRVSERIVAGVGKIIPLRVGEENLWQVMI